MSDKTTTKTFRQTVEEIQSARMCISEHCPQLKDASITCGNCRTDRICSAVLKMADGMPKTQCVCQSWIREQIK